MREAERRTLRCVGIVLLSREQADLARRVQERSNVAVMVHPVTLKQLHRKLQELVPTEGDAASRPH
jgi:hypothetical protein